MITSEERLKLKIGDTVYLPSKKLECIVNGVVKENLTVDFYFFTKDIDFELMFLNKFDALNELKNLLIKEIVFISKSIDSIDNQIKELEVE